jgi:hypothetical protein
MDGAFISRRIECLDRLCTNLGVRGPEAPDQLWEVGRLPAALPVFASASKVTPVRGGSVSALPDRERSPRPKDGRRRSPG